MMRFFELTANSFDLKLTLEEGNLHEVIIPIDNDQFVNEKNLPLKMKVIKTNEETLNNRVKSNKVAVDVFEWSSDFTVGGNAPEKGGAFLIISKKVKNIFEKYNLPNHQFYPIQIESNYKNILNKNYVLFHMIGNGIFGDEFVDYSNCTFEEITMDENEDRKVINTFPEGSVNSNKEFKSIKLNESQKIKLGTYEFMGIPGYMVPNDFNFKNKVFHYDFDVLWGAANQIYISEEIKKELENNNITNANYFKIKENLVRAFEYKKNNS